ncbi:unnamed protein product [Rhodiola kirilowii]
MIMINWLPRFDFLGMGGYTKTLWGDGYVLAYYETNSPRPRHQLRCFSLEVSHAVRVVHYRFY